MTPCGRRFLALVTALLAVSIVDGCGGSSSSSSAELRARRAGLAQVAHALLAAREAVAREVSAARLAWPLVDHGIPSLPSAPARAKRDAHPPTRKERAEALARERRRAALARRLAAIDLAVGTAAAEAERLPVPLLSHSEELTGAGSEIAGVYELAAGLIAHGWPQVKATVTAVRSGPRATQAFLRGNVNTYIISAYDGNFDLSLLGKELVKAYKRLGAKKQFGSSLTPQEVKELAAAYAPRGEQLHPHPWQGLVSH
jgi:hypothetical protein